jgi:nitrite reductase/ring-hydroxylating ferredoxin subunit
LRRYFARLEEGAATVEGAGEEESPPARSDGYVFAAKVDALPDSTGVTVQIQGKEYALFRMGDRVTAIDAACPHAGGRLGDGEVRDGVVTCPLHGWAFNVCTGSSLDPPGNDVVTYPVLVEDGKVFIQTSAEASSKNGSGTAQSSDHAGAAVPAKRPAAPVAST